MSKKKILIVDDEKDICKILSSLVKSEGFKPMVAFSGEEALKIIRQEIPDLMIVDIRMPGMSGMELMQQAKAMDRNLPTILITAHADTKGAVQAIKEGAHDYLAKPFDNSEVIRVVHRALAERELKVRLHNLSNQIKDNDALRQKMGPSDSVSRLISEVSRVAESNFSVIIIGETGSGKEVIARAIHQGSPRSKNSFVAVDCGAIPETLLESELFGYEKGAFTGAEVQRIGKFELAQGGTLLLDEISNLPVSSQAKLLRVLQEKKLYRVGGTKPINVDVRVLAASNQDLLDLLNSGSFRRDLFYRLNEFTIRIPPLRERKDDIPYLSKRFLDSANVELNKKIGGFAESALNLLFSHPWPGNVRQLRSTIRRAALLADDLITEKHLDLNQDSEPAMAARTKIQPSPFGNRPLREILKESIQGVEREVLTQVLRQTGGNKAKAARLLQIDYKTMHTKLKTLGIQTREEFPDPMDDPVKDNSL